MSNGEYIRKYLEPKPVAVNYLEDVFCFLKDKTKEMLDNLDQTNDDDVKALNDIFYYLVKKEPYIKQIHDKKCGCDE